MSKRSVSDDNDNERKQPRRSEVPFANKQRMWIEALTARTLAAKQIARGRAAMPYRDISAWAEERVEAGQRATSTAVELNNALPLSLLFLPLNLVIDGIGQYFEARDFLANCETLPAFAYRFCGSAKIVRPEGEPQVNYYGLTDNEVAWQLWSHLLQRDFGLSVNPDLCSADAACFRTMAASAVQKFIADELEGIGLNAQLVEREPNRRRLLAYKKLYRILYGSYVEPIHLNYLTGVGLELVYEFGLEHGILGLSNVINGPNNQAPSLLVSIVSIVNLLEDLKSQRYYEEGTPIAVTLTLRLFDGLYGRVLQYTGLLRWLSSTLFVAGDQTFLVPRQPDAGGDEPRRVDQFQNAIKVAAPDSTYRRPFLGDDGASLLFDVQYRKYNEEGISPRAQAINQFRIEDGALSPNVIRVDVRSQPIVSFVFPRTQTEKTFLTVSDPAASPVLYTRDAVIEIHLFSTRRRVFSLPLLDLIANHELYSSSGRYEVQVAIGLTEKDTGRYLILIAPLPDENDVSEYAETFTLIHVVKIDLQADGLVRAADLHIIPRRHSESDVGIISSRFAYLSADEDFFIFDWSRNTITLAPGAGTQGPFFVGYHDDPGDLFLPTFSFSNVTNKPPIQLPYRISDTPRDNYTIAYLDPIHLPIVQN